MERFGGRKITWSGEGEMPERAKDALQNSEIKALWESPEIQEVREKIGFIDFGVLRSIFADMYSHFGFEAKEMNFFEANTISNKTGFLAAGTYRSHENTLGINLSTIYRDVAVEDIGEDLAIAGVLFHEETHAVGRVHCHYSPERDDTPLRSLGYSVEVHKPTDADTLRHKGVQSNNYFDEFNEGVTELITYEILGKYAERTRQFSEEEVQKYIRVRSSHEYVRIAEDFIARLADRSNLSAAEITESIKRGYFTETNFLEDILREYPDLADGTGYMAKLATGNLNQEVGKHRKN